MGVGETRPLSKMPIYEYYCCECGCVETAIRPVSECSYGYGCPNCRAAMARVFSPPALLGRSKPGGWKFDPATGNGWDSRLAAMRRSESEGAAATREAKKNWGRAWDATLRYKKEKFA